MQRFALQFSFKIAGKKSRAPAAVEDPFEFNADAAAIDPKPRTSYASTRKRLIPVAVQQLTKRLCIDTAYQHASLPSPSPDIPIPVADDFSRETPETPAPNAGPLVEVKKEVNDVVAEWDELEYERDLIISGRHSDHDRPSSCVSMKPSGDVPESADSMVSESTHADRQSPPTPSASYADAFAVLYDMDKSVCCKSSWGACGAQQSEPWLCGICLAAIYPVAFS